MNDKPSKATMPDAVAALVECGFAAWASDAVSEEFRARFDAERIPVVGVRHVRVWGLQVDDERALPGLERTSIPDEEIWEVNLRAKNGSIYEVASKMLQAADTA